MDDWIDRKAALKLLGVKAQTLYAYVSRGRISTQADPLDPRRSLYRQEDIAMLATRRARGRKTAAIAESSMAWGEPTIPTALSIVRHGRLYYRGQDAIELARTATLEEAAALLWDSRTLVAFEPAPCGALDPFVALGAFVHESESTLGRSRERLCRDAGKVVGLLLSAVGCDATDEPAHLRLSGRWGLDKAGAERIRQALVVMADHDLNASTFATRVAASTGASMAANVLAGLCALSGPKHGGLSAAVMSLLDQAEQAGPALAFQRWLDREAGLPGFGHPLYPSGDPRGALMLEGVVLDPLMTEICNLVADTTGLLPNCDFALAAFVRACSLPPDAPLVVFMIGRSIGWCAHAMEQILHGQLIRPRGRYIGHQPQ
jgi:citrate synthase